jgi:hypothetical protein
VDRKENSWSLLKGPSFNSTINCWILEFEDDMKTRMSTFLLGYEDQDIVEHVKSLGFEVD